MSMTMSQTIQAAQEHARYYVSNASNHLAGLKVEAPVAAALLDSRALWALGVVVALVLARIFTQKPKLPAGVKRLPRVPGLPYIGQPLGVPESGAEADRHFGELHKNLGPIYEWEVMGTTHVWIENDRIARDLLLHRGKKHGDQNELPAAVGVPAGSGILPLMSIGENFWRHKNVIHSLNRNAYVSDMSFGYPELENMNTLRRILESPDKWSQQLVTHSARTVARTAWGDAKHSTKLLQIVPVLLEAPSSGGLLPNLVPALINPWVKQEAAQRQRVQDLFYEAQEDVIDRFQAGVAEDSWTKLWLEKAQGPGKGDVAKQEAAHAIGTNALISTVTIGSPLHNFFTAICHYPSWQSRLHEELDRVCGDRLPTMADMPNLPVLRAVVKETLRWRQPTPFGVPHITTDDHVYDGRHISKHAMVHANHYLMSREPKTYPAADEWRPERWLEPSWPTYKEPLSEYPTIQGDAGFGYGLRACNDLVATELYTTIGSIAWAFDIKRIEGRQGHDNRSQTNPYVMTMASQFPCTVTARSAEKAKYIAGGCEDHSLLVKGSAESSDDHLAE